MAEADVFLIDIQQDGSSGIELGRQLMQAHPQIKIIFISGYVRYAPEVYEVPHVYFVWKPDLEVRLPQALQAACRESRRSVLPLNWKGHKKFIFMDEIMYIERELRKSRIVLPECEHYVYMTLEELMVFATDRALNSVALSPIREHLVAVGGVEARDVTTTHSEKMEVAAGRAVNGRACSSKSPRARKSGE